MSEPYGLEMTMSQWMDCLAHAWDKGWGAAWSPMSMHNLDDGPNPYRVSFPQRHPAMRVARNIVNQILDEAGTDIDTRQRINDDCDQFVARMLETYSTRGGAA